MRPRPPLSCSLLVFCVLAACGRAPSLPATSSEQTVDGQSLSDVRLIATTGDKASRLRAVRQLPAFGEPALGVLEEAVGDPAASVRAAALRAIGEVQPDEERWSQLLARYLADGQPVERTAAGTALAHVGLPALSSLASLMHVDDPNVRARAALVVAKLPMKIQTHAVWVLAANDENWVVRREVARALTHPVPSSRESEHVRAVMALLQDGVPNVQSLAADAAARHVTEDDKLKSALVSLLESPHGRVRAAAAEALGRCKDADLLARLRAMALEDESTHARIRAALGHWRGSGSVKTVRVTLLGALNSRRTETRRLALRCIGELGTDAGPLVEAVAERLHDRALRVAAIESLAQLGPAAQAAIPALQRLRARMKPYTARRIDVALERIDG